MGFKKGDKIKCINNTGYAGDGSLTVGKVYEVLRDQGTSECVRINVNEGYEYGPYASRFEPVPKANGVDAKGNELAFTDADLKPFQRVKMGDGRFVMVTLNERGETGLTYEGESWMPARINHDGGHGEYDVQAVYAPPRNHVDGLTMAMRGELIWKRADTAKLQAIKAADAAVAEAEAALNAAKAARAAL